MLESDSRKNFKNWFIVINSVIMSKSYEVVYEKDNLGYNG